MGYVANPGDLVDFECIMGSCYAFEIACVRFAAASQMRPPYDPKSERMRM